MSQDLEADGVMAVVLHPGHVRTRMGGDHARVSTEQSISGMIKVLGELKEKDNGKLFDFNGEQLPW